MKRTVLTYLMTAFHHQKVVLPDWEKLKWIYELKPTLTNPNLTPDWQFHFREDVWSNQRNDCILFRHGNYHVIKYCYGHVVRILWRQNRPSIDLWLLFRDNGDSVNKNKSVNNTNIKNELEKTISSKTVSSFSSSFWVPIHNTLFYRLSRLGCWRRVRGISHVDFYG